MLLRILTFFKWVYGNPLTFLVGIRRIPAYHVDYTTGSNPNQTHLKQLIKVVMMQLGIFFQGFSGLELNSAGEWPSRINVPRPCLTLALLKNIPYCWVYCIRLTETCHSIYILLLFCWFFIVFIFKLLWIKASAKCKCVCTHLHLVI